MARGATVWICLDRREASRSKAIAVALNRREKSSTDSAEEMLVLEIIGFTSTLGQYKDAARLNGVR